jgi:creatinine amidohydrolase
MSAAGPELTEMTWPDVHARVAAGAVLAVPVGATEQHGPHLPLDTDTRIAEALAHLLAARRDDVLLAPALPYGSSGEHAGFPGTLSIGQEATYQLLVELVRSASMTFRRILLVVGHGGNAEPVNRAVPLLRSEGRDVIAWSPLLPGDAHAGRTETSLMLHLAPETVRSDAARAGNTEGLAALLPHLRTGGVKAVSANGVLGDPGGASADEGAALLAAALADLDLRLARWVEPPG